MSEPVDSFKITDRLTLLLSCILILITLVVFIPCVYNGFIIVDDSALVYNNEKIFTLTHVGEYFTTFHRRLYHPLVLLSYAIEFHFFGLNPMAYHFTNLMLHLINAFLAFWFFQALLGRRAVAFFVALLFAVHPLRVESVAWISERKDMMFSLFYLMAMVLHITYQRSHQKRIYWVVLLAFLCALLSKPMAVTLPLILLLLDHMRYGELNKKLIIEKLPHVVLSLVFGVITLVGHHYAGGGEHRMVGSIAMNLLEANYNVLLYIYKTILPIHLSFTYPHFIESDVLMRGYIWYSPLATLIVVAAILFSLRYTAKVVYGMLLFLIALLPVMNIVPFGLGIPGDRMTYIPHLGLFYIVGAGLAVIWDKRSLMTRSARYLGLLCACVIVLVLCSLTYQRCGLWRNSTRLLSDVVRKFPDEKTSVWEYKLLSQILSSGNEHALAREYLLKAMQLSGTSESFGLHAQYWGQTNKADLLCKEYEKMLAKGECYYTDIEAMTLYLQLNRPDDALSVSERSLGWNPEYSWLIYRLRGQAFDKKHDYQKAVESYTMALRRNPYDYAAYALRGVTYGKMNEKILAQEDKDNSQRYSVFNPNIHFSDNSDHDIIFGW